MSDKRKTRDSFRGRLLSAVTGISTPDHIIKLTREIEGFLKRLHIADRLLSRAGSLLLKLDRLLGRLQNRICGICRWILLVVTTLNGASARMKSRRANEFTARAVAILIASGLVALAANTFVSHITRAAHYLY